MDFSVTDFAVLATIAHGVPKRVVDPRMPCTVLARFLAADMHTGHFCTLLPSLRIKAFSQDFFLFIATERAEGFFHRLVRCVSGLLEGF